MIQVYASEIAGLSKSARKGAEAGGRKVLRELTAEYGPNDLDRSGVIDAVYEEMSSRCGASQYDDGAGQDRWWAMREVAEAIIFEAQPGWDIEPEPIV